MASSSKTIPQKEYLKKYFSKKKKCKRVSSKERRVKVVDDNIDSFRIHDDYEMESGDDAPVIAAIIDERPREIRKMEYYQQTNRWKPLENAKNDGHDDSHSRRNESDTSRRNAQNERDQKNHRNLSLSRHERPSRVDLSPPRPSGHPGRHSGADFSPPRKVKTPGRPTELDLSPPRRSRTSDRLREAKVSSRRNRNSERSCETDLLLSRRTKNIDRTPESSFSPRRNRHYERRAETDSSQPRRVKNTGSFYRNNSSPERDCKDSDFSPPLRNRINKDLSPPRRDRNGKNFSPPLRDRSEIDISSPCRNRHEKYSCGPSPRRYKFVDTRSQSLTSPLRIKWKMKNPADSVYSNTSRNDMHATDNRSPRRRNERVDNVSPSERNRHEVSRRDWSPQSRREYQNASSRPSRDDVSSPRRSHRESSSTKRKHRSKENLEFLLLSPGDQHLDGHRPNYSLLQRNQFDHLARHIDEKQSSDPSQHRKSKLSDDLSPCHRRQHSRSPPRKISSRYYEHDSLRRNEELNVRSKCSESPSGKQNLDKSMKEEKDSSLLRKKKLEEKSSHDTRYSKAVPDKHLVPRKKHVSSRSLSPNEKRSNDIETDWKDRHSKKKVQEDTRKCRTKLGEDSSLARKKEKSKKHKSKDKDKSSDGKFDTDKSTFERKSRDNAVPESDKNPKKSIIYSGTGVISQPLSRFIDDKDLNDTLKEKEGLEDPMLEYMQKKKRKKEEKLGIIRRPEYRGTFPQNRFGIRPGHKWDGVDRSNGFEKKWFAKQGERKVIEQEAYRWGTEDM